MPGDGLVWQDGQGLWGQELTKAVLNESVPMERSNDMALRVVAAWYQLGQNDKSLWPNNTLSGSPTFSSTDESVGKLHPSSPGIQETAVVNQFVPVRNTDEGGNHDELAGKIAAEGIVLVKNANSLLPLSRNGTTLMTHSSSGKIRIDIFGEDAFVNSRGRNVASIVVVTKALWLWVGARERSSCLT